MSIIELVIAFGLLLIAFILNRHLKGRGKKLPPGPVGLPFVGYLPFIDAKNPHHSLTRLAEKYGRIYSLQMGGIFTVVLSDVKLVRRAFALDSFSGRAPLYLTHGIMKENGMRLNFLATYFLVDHLYQKNGEYVSPGFSGRKRRKSRDESRRTNRAGEKWRDQRKFAVNCLRNLGMVKFGEKRFKLCRDVKNGVDQLLGKINLALGKPIDLEDLLMHSLGNVVFNLVFGKTWNEEDETWKKLISLQEEGTKLIGVAGPINFLPILRFLPKYKKAMEYLLSGIAYSHDIYQKILEEHKTKQNLISGQTSGESEGETNYSHFLGAFCHEMEKRKSEPGFYTLNQFNYLMADLWGAGVDTTITTLRWFFFHLAHNRDVQANIQREMDETLGERDLTMEDVSFLPYLQASMSEVQRLCSVTPLGIPHGTLEDSVLEGYYIPKGTMIVPLQWAIHMNPSLHKRPNTYDPSRFLDDEGNYVKLESFIPFQTGKRMCLGEEYAKILLFLYGGTIVQNFTFSLDSLVDFEGEVGITLTPKPHKIKFQKRERK